MANEPIITVERAQGWATVLLNRPERRNALTGPMLDELANALDLLSAEADIAAIVLRGAGGAFCSGVDLTELQLQPPHPWVPLFSASLRRAHIALFKCPCPVIVALERFAINGGSAFALAGDMAVAGQGAFLQIGEIRLGTAAPMNLAWLRLKSSESVLARLAYLGDRVGSAELLRLGLVTEVVEDGQVRARAEAIATQLAACPAGSSRLMKAGIRAPRAIDADAWFISSAGPGLQNAKQLKP